MSSQNKVFLIGNVGQDPEVTEKFAKFSLATAEHWKDKAGVKQSKTEWHNCVSFSPGLNSVIEKYVKKGGTISVEGKIQSSSYEDKNGNKQKSTSIFVEKIILLGKSGGNDSSVSQSDNSYQEEEPPKKKAGRPSKEAMGDNDDDGDLPF